MRVEFKHPGQAQRWFKISKQVLASAVAGPVGMKLPTQRIRNAMCRGFGYSSFSELQLVFRKRGYAKVTLPTADETLHALSVGFFLALDEARALGFHQEADEEELAVQLARQTVEFINERELANERERDSANPSRRVGSST